MVAPRIQETEDLLRWAVDGLRAELGEQKIDPSAYESRASFLR